MDPSAATSCRTFNIHLSEDGDAEFSARELRSGIPAKRQITMGMELAAIAIDEHLKGHTLVVLDENGAYLYEYDVTFHSQPKHLV